MNRLLDLLKATTHALETPGDYSPAELKELLQDAGKFLTDHESAQPNTMTGLQVSVDGGVTWQSSSGIRALFHDANETDDGMEDLLVNITTEGIIFDLMGQESGEISRTASLMASDLIDRVLSDAPQSPVVSDADQAARGASLAEVFYLRKDLERKDRFRTYVGTKTALGVYALAKRIIEEGI